MIQIYKLSEQDFRGSHFADWPSDLKGNNDLLVLTKPDTAHPNAGLPNAFGKYDLDAATMAEQIGE